MNRFLVRATLLGLVVALAGCEAPKDIATDPSTTQKSVAATSRVAPKPTAGTGNSAQTTTPTDPSTGASPTGHGAASHTHEHFSARGSTVTEHGIPLFRETQTFQWSPEERAQRVCVRLNSIAETHDFDADSVFMRRVNGLLTVFYYHQHGGGSEGHIVATVDPLTAREFGFERQPEQLAYWWRDVLRDHARIISGEAPQSTTRYSSPLRLLYERLQRRSPGVPTHEAFETTLAELPAAELDDLQNLYRTVPAGYRPQPDDVRTATTGHHHQADQAGGNPSEHAEGDHHQDAHDDHDHAQ